MRYLLQRIRSKFRNAHSIYVNEGFMGVIRKICRILGRNRNGCWVDEETGETRYADNRRGYIPFDAEYEDDEVLPDQTLDVRALAFYLPQFHTFPENDKWWGKGFMEWTNTRACTEPRFEGQYQPRTPHQDIGYYDLADFEVLRRQVQLAKEHGIYGFCFYYYWFSGKRLLEKPVDQLLAHPEVDFPFCLCWANENWTRAWDGQNSDVLIRQEYSERDDVRFMEDLKPYMEDSRYIRIGGKPVILVYNPGEIPDCQNTFRKWRESAQQLGIGEILIWVCDTANHTAESLSIESAVDAEVEFPPHNMWYESMAVHGLALHGRYAYTYNYQCLVRYQEKLLKEQEHDRAIPIHHACMLGWDNSARRKNLWCTYYAFSLRYFYRWMRALVQNARENFQTEERYIFINAWNEWAEGTYLEPDDKYGYAYLNTASRALHDLPYEKSPCVINLKQEALSEEAFAEARSMDTARIAVQIHIFYLQTLEETTQQINQIPYPFDCYVSTDTEEKREIIERHFLKVGRQNALAVKVFPNRGRDVGPFLAQMAPVLARYDYIGHIHSKMTTHSDYGNEWREYNFRNLFGSQDYLKRLFFLFESDSRLGILFPPTFPALERQAIWGGNREQSAALLKSIGVTAMLPAIPTFPVGNMFWARTKAVAPLFVLKQKDFPNEEGQINATLAHCVERCWVYVAKKLGYDFARVLNDCNYKGREGMPVKRLTLFMHYDAGNHVSKSDLSLLGAIKSIGSDIVAVTNSPISAGEQEKLRAYAQEIVFRENRGYDFGAWREAMLHIGFSRMEAYDEVVLLNNSIEGPYFPLDEMFQTIASREPDVDFWGVTLFPYCADGSYLGIPFIPEHLQSYFLVFKRQVVQSEAFQSFWQKANECDTREQAIVDCEIRLTEILHDAGFIYVPYIRESAYMSLSLNCYSIPYTYPTALLLLRDPFVKRKCREQASDQETLKLQALLRQLHQEAPKTLQQ